MAWLRRSASRCSVTRPSFLCATLCLIVNSVGSGLWALGSGPMREPKAESREASLVLMRLRGLVEAHAQAQSHRVQDLLDLVERLPAEVLRLQHLRLGLLHELANRPDVR